MTTKFKESQKALTDITNDCKYLVYPKHGGGVFYHVQAEQKSCYRSVASIVDGELKISPGIEDDYIIKMKKDILIIYRIGNMRY